MKRCPQCQFIYLDTDSVCDFDGAQLVSVSESELGVRDTNSPVRNSFKTLIIVFGSLLVLLILGTSGLYMIRAKRRAPLAPSPSAETTVSTAGAIPAPTADQTVLAQPTAEPKNSVVANPTRSPAVASSIISKKPVSTGSHDDVRSGATILLTNGTRIEADEVWHTREGIWYRRRGMVTLLKPNKVKSIQKR
jgi:hypothetical protein